MEEIFTGIAAKSSDSGESDRLIKILTPTGVKTALMRGVKKPKAKLKAYSLPLAFCEYTAVKRGSVYVITSAAPLGDFYTILGDGDKISAASLCLEAALNSFIGDDTADLFIFLLKRLKDICGGDPYAAAARFIQYVIHNSGFSYPYDRCGGDPKTVMELLAVLHFTPENDPAPPLEPSLTKQSLKKLIKNFEQKFDCILNSKKNVASLL